MTLESIRLFEILPAVLSGDKGVELDLSSFAGLQSMYMMLQVIHSIPTYN